MVHENGAQNHPVDASFQGSGRWPTWKIKRVFVKNTRSTPFLSSALDIKWKYPVIQGSIHGDLWSKRTCVRLFISGQET